MARGRWVLLLVVWAIVGGSLAAFKEDLNDNVLTFRMQFRF